MKKHRFYILITFFILLCIPAFAHQPRLVGHEKTVNVPEPEISKAYYAELHGAPVQYIIRSDVPFKLYVNILVPDIKGIKKNVSARISSGGKIVTILGGANAKWEHFYEEFGGDNYFKGPEYSRKVPAGVYEILISSPDNKGKYVIATGDKEAFPFMETLNTLMKMPLLKLYFNESPFMAYFNRIGIFLSPVILLIIVLIAGAVFVLRKALKK